MPIEIRELVIKATVDTGGNNNSGSGSNGSTNNNVSFSEELLNACVEKIIEILKEKNER